MKYCLNYAKSSTMLDEADEIIINSKNDIKLITDYIKEHDWQRIIIDIEDNDPLVFDKFAQILLEEEDLDYSIRLSKYDKSLDEIIEKYKEKPKVKFFFDSFVRDFDTLNGYVKLGVSDVYLVEEMCFNLDKVQQLLQDTNIQVRVFVNIAQSNWKNTSAIKKFFIRPEDIKYYEDYIDVCEFFGQQNRIDETFRVYKDVHEWNGILNELIMDLDEDEIDSRFIIHQFAERRVKCGKKCMWRWSM